MSMTKVVLTVVAVVAVLFLGGLALSSCGYIYADVKQGETGIVLKRSVIESVVSPGRYSAPLCMFCDLDVINTSAIRFCAEDPEVLTSDQQRIGVKVCGTVKRTDYTNEAKLKEMYATYKTIYQDDRALVGTAGSDGNYTGSSLMNDLSFQAMKVCVGNAPFAKSVVGTSRDELRQCIDEELSKLATNYALDVQNIVVPNVILHPTVQQLLDAITQARFETDKARQDALKAAAEADRELAVQQGAIKVSQGKVQEELRQRSISAELEKKALESELVVITQKKANELRQAVLKKEISQADLEVATLDAQKTLAVEFARARMFEDNEAYLALTIQEVWAEAWEKSGAKFIVSPDVSPMLIMNTGVVTPTVAIPATAP